MRLTTNVKIILKKILDLLCPCCCVICGGKVNSNIYKNICDHCSEEISWIHKPFCIQCGKAFDGEVMHDKICQSCIELNPIFQNGRSCFNFSGAGRLLIHYLKYKSGDFLGDDIATLIKEKCPHIIDFVGNAILVPAPLHSIRKFTRDFNQSTIIAQAIAKIAKDCSICDMLKRTKNTKSQTLLSGKEREQNVKNIFICKKNYIVENKRIIVIDDVITTGNTINECCKALAICGYKKIDIITLAHG